MNNASGFSRRNWKKWISKVIELPLTFYIILPIVAMLYASVGHGGASGYLALMTLFNAQTSLMKPTALVLNLFVAGISFFWYWRKNFFSWKLFYPFAITSVPAAFIGGYIQLNPNIYKQILGVLLLLSIAKMLGWVGQESKEIKRSNLVLSLIIGFVIGLFSGMIGIGGGIVLSPIILLLHWAKMKETAAVSALFIWINSIAALSGMLVSGAAISGEIIWLVGFTVTGGWIGAYLGSSWFDNLLLRRLLAVVLAVASFKLLLV